MVKYALAKQDHKTRSTTFSVLARESFLVLILRTPKIKVYLKQSLKSVSSQAQMVISYFILQEQRGLSMQRAKAYPRPSCVFTMKSRSNTVLRGTPINPTYRTALIKSSLRKKETPSFYYIVFRQAWTRKVAEQHYGLSSIAESVSYLVMSVSLWSSFRPQNPTNISLFHANEASLVQICCIYDCYVKILLSRFYSKKLILQGSSWMWTVPNAGNRRCSHTCV